MTVWIRQTVLHRFIDDWIVIAPTRCKLFSTVSIVNITLNLLKVEKHPHKTFISKVERGFDFPGYYFKSGVLRGKLWSNDFVSDNQYKAFN